MRLNELLAADDAGLAANVAGDKDRDNRRVLAKPLDSETTRVYLIMLAKYKDWAHTEGYQSEILFLDDAKLGEFVSWMKLRRYAPNTIETALSALKHWAEREDLSPMPTFREAKTRWDAYVVELAARGLIYSVDDPRIKRGVH